jgi:uncharacterized protein
MHLLRGKGGTFLGAHPASTKIRHRPVDPQAHGRYAAAIRNIPPKER